MTIDPTGTGDDGLTLALPDIDHASSSSDILLVEGDDGDAITADLSGAGFVVFASVPRYADYTNAVPTLRVANAVDRSGISL